MELHTHDTNGRPPARSLFKEFNPEGKYSIQEWRKTFVALNDPTEYRAAIALLGSWQEWEDMKSRWPYFRDVLLVQWQEELEVSLRCDAFKTLCDQAIGEGDTRAAMFIVEGKHKPKGVGRPKDTTKMQENRIREAVVRETDADVARVREGMKTSA